MPYGKKSGNKRRQTRRVGRSSRVQGRKVSGRKRFLPKKMGHASKAVIRQPSGLADSLYVKLRYVSDYTYSIVAGSGVSQVMRGNSIFDPDFTGTGGQPYFFDQWSSLYQSYTVLGSSISAIAFSGSGAAAYNLTVVPSSSSTVFGSGGNELAAEQPYARYRLSQLNQPARKVKHYMSTNKVLGLNRSQITNDPNFSALITTNPTTQWYWHIYANDVVMSSSITLAVRISLTYYVRFFGRARPSVS